MEQKKRHNPPIFEEDSAVNAFDRNNDAAIVEETPVEEKNDLEKAIQTAMTSQEEVVAKKGEGALREEFIYLITRIFGEDIYIMDMSSGEFEPQKEIYKLKSTEVYWPLAKLKQKRRWFEFKKYEEFARIIPQVKETQLFDESGEKLSKEKKVLLMFEDSHFNPIKITAYTPEGLRKSKLFAKAYKAFTGQEVEVIRECVDEEEMKKTGLEGVVEKTPEVKVRVEGDLLGIERTVYAGDKKISIEVNNREWFNNFCKYLEQTFAPKYKVKLVKRSAILPFHNPAFKIIDCESEQVVARMKYNYVNLDFRPRRGLTVKVYDSKVLPEIINFKEDYAAKAGGCVTVYGNI